MALPGSKETAEIFGVFDANLPLIARIVPGFYLGSLAGSCGQFIARNETNPLKEATSHPSLKSQAMRLALYLHSIQQTPNVSGESYPECVGNLMS